MFYKKGKTFMLLLAAWIFLATPGQGGTIFDNFDDNIINPSLWFEGVYPYPPLAGPYPSISETSKHLEMTFPSSSSESFFDAYLGFSKILRGDFDVQVDFNLLDWTAGNGIRAGITTGLQFNLFRASLGQGEEGGPKEEYSVFYNGSLTEVLTTDTAGKLRIKRTGNKVEGFYWNWENGIWQSIVSYTDPTLGVETEIYIEAVTGDPSYFLGQTVTVAFDNFRVTNPYIGNNLSPLLLLLD
jgi:hypothetical protein